MPALREQQSQGCRTAKPQLDILWSRAVSPQPVLAILCAIKMCGVTQGNPLDEALVEPTEQLSRHTKETFKIVIINRVPVGMQWI